MSVRWITDRLRRLARRPRRRERPRSERRVLSLLALEGRSVPSVTPLAPPADYAPIALYRTDETSLDGLTRLTSWSSTQMEHTDVQADSPPESGAPLSVAAFMGVFLGSAAVFEYDLEADARASQVFHGVKV
jgi:hypothetical protein